jgi:HD-GYP domain-containing protein (c-di-GMP phosphodiesterase class II)
VRVFLVLLAGIGAVIVTQRALMTGSVPYAVAAGVLVLIALLTAFLRRSPRRDTAPVPAAASPAAIAGPPSLSVADSLPEQPEAVPVAPGPEELEEPVPAPAEVAEAPGATAEESTGPAGVPTDGPPVEAGPASGVVAASESEWVTPPVRTPYSVDPTVVLMSLYDAAALRYDALSAHLWLEDAPTSTLRLIAAFGPRVPASEPVSFDDPVLGQAARSGNAVFASLDVPSAHDPDAIMWRYAVPVGTPEMRGVAAVDIATSDAEPACVVLNEVTAVLRGSLTASVAIHIAHAEMETAVLLLEAAADLTSGGEREEVLHSALARAMRLARATTGSVMLPDAESGGLRIFASKGLSDDIVATTELAEGEGIAGLVYSSSSPLLVEDLPGRPGCRRHGVLSSVSVPIADQHGSFGVLNVGSRSFPARLTDAYVRALGILGAQTAVALRNVDAAQRSWDLYLENLQALATALEANDPFRRGAAKRIALLSVALGEAMGLSGEELVSLRIAAILHDVGMGLATGSVGATDRPLSTVDRGLVRAHPKVASDVMLQVPSLEGLAPVVRHHHERFDGDGYDTGLAGSAIPMGSRILAVADAFVAITSPRPYRVALELEEALEELSATSGSQFDPEVVETFVRLLAERPDLALADR